MRVRVMLLAFLMLAAPAVAADIDGRWSGTMMTPMGDFPIAFVFKADGSKLTGAMIGMDGTEIPIANGKIEGNTLSYTVSLDFGGMALEFTYKGVLEGTDLKLNGTVFEMPFELVVKKEK